MSHANLQSLWQRVRATLSQPTQQKWASYNGREMVSHLNLHIYDLLMWGSFFPIYVLVIWFSYFMRPLLGAFVHFFSWWNVCLYIIDL